MKEFGSYFHYLTNDTSFKNELFNYPDSRLYANGRHAIQDLIGINSWKRIWLPSYFCYDVVEAIKDTGIVIEFYHDGPGLDDDSIITKLTFRESDVILRMNYFGLRTFRDNSNIPIEVIEDHSHDLSGDWVKKSNADYCCSSLRKLIPLPEGGILWSPKAKNLPPPINSSTENELLTYKRLTGMLLKTMYLENYKINKESFRQEYLESENAFINLKISGISDASKHLLSSFDFLGWTNKRKKNWSNLVKKTKHRYEILLPEDLNICNPFSLIIKHQSMQERNSLQKYLISQNVYPAVLWEIPLEHDNVINELSSQLLSIHCDGRYNTMEINELATILLSH